MSQPTKSHLENSKSDTEHHKRLEYCKTRLKYREGKSLKAVKVYTIANESKHLLVFGVPRINLRNELRKTFLKHGSIINISSKTEALAKTIELEQFTDVFHIQFEKIEHARRAKRFLDAQQFYGGILHISYAPEYESMDETRQKLVQRTREVAFRIKRAQNK